MPIRRAQRDIEAIRAVDARAFGTGPYAAARDGAGDTAWRDRRRAEITAWYRDHYRETFVAIADRRGAAPHPGPGGLTTSSAAQPLILA